jgi:putative transcriptional regulator
MSQTRLDCVVRPALNRAVATLKGHFLLASPALTDGNFLRAVVLLVRHDQDGALGVKVNDPLDVTVADALGESVEAARDIAATLFRGGPCNGPMVVLHGDLGGEEVLPGVQFTASKDGIERVMLDRVEPARYCISYAGWEADQLEQELAEGAWVIVPATPQDVFGPHQDLWARLMSRANLLKFIRPDQIPDHPELN